MVEYQVTCDKCGTLITDRATQNNGIVVQSKNVVSVAGKEFHLCNECIKELQKYITGNEPAEGVSKVVEDVVEKLGDIAEHVQDAINNKTGEEENAEKVPMRDRTAAAIQKAADNGYLGQVIADVLVRSLNIGCDGVDTLVDKIRGRLK